MAISRIGSASAAATSVTLPTHQRGDLIIIAAHRGDVAGLTAPAGWVHIESRLAGTQALFVAYKIAASNAETSGTWTGAQQLIAVVYRGAGLVIPGAENPNSAGSGTSVTYSAFQGEPGSGVNQWIVGFGATVTPATGIQVAPTGLTAIANVQAAVGHLAAHDSNANSTWATSQSTTITSGRWACVVLQIAESGFSERSRPTHPMQSQVIG
jgi:hypothetical protein